MNLDAETLDYLYGRRFSNGHVFDLGNKGACLRRSERLLQLVQGLRVLHVGCCDHLPLIQEKRQQGLYLHENLCRVATQCVGIDTNTEGVALLRSTGFPDVYTPDNAPPFSIVNGEERAYDICLLADVIEHIGNPVEFLASMRRYQFKRLVVVTPNAFRWRNSLPGGEAINTDHRFWFTPYTLCKVLVDAGFEPQRVELCHSDYATWRGVFAAKLLGLIPRWRDTLLVEAVNQI
ncbi:MAG: methyltransferase domain-containing protein [Burkholderiaceae bacterium]|nr:methyltransferase domain-containing protein [Burkholderiaceae bacterium]MCB1987569.1 methyltransferase domain-containing protein [Burkholderiaceae bacterium]